MWCPRMHYSITVHYLNSQLLLLPPCDASGENRCMVKAAMIIVNDYNV